MITFGHDISLRDLRFIWRYKSKYLKQMKVRDSGMPDEQNWSSHFDVDKILDEMEVSYKLRHVVEIGFGFGTFTIPAAKRISGTLHAFDIDPQMKQHLDHSIQIHQTAGTNLSDSIKTHIRDAIAESTGLHDNVSDYVMLFNIMHHEHPEELLGEARRILKPGGLAGIIHWRSDIPTPRGPDLSIRPTPEYIVSQFQKSGFRVFKGPLVLKPYHFGVLGRIT